MKRLEANTAEKNLGQKVAPPPLSLQCVPLVLKHLSFSPRRGEKLVKWWFNAMRWWWMREGRGRRCSSEFWKHWRKVLLWLAGGVSSYRGPMLWLALQCISSSCSVCAAEKGIALHCIGWLGGKNALQTHRVHSVHTAGAENTIFWRVHRVVVQCRSALYFAVMCIAMHITVQLYAKMHVYWIISYLLQQYWRTSSTCALCSSQVHHVQTFVSERTWALKWYFKQPW